MKILKELPLCHGLTQGIIHITSDDSPPCGALLLLGSPFSVLLRFSGLWIFNDGQAILPAQLVRCSLHIVVVLGRTKILDAIYKGNRVQHKMVMQMIGLIQMGGNHHLIPFAP